MSETPTELDSGARAVIDLMDGFRASKALFVAVSLGVFDLLHERPRTCPELAADLDCAAHALERMLGFCAARGLLRIDEAGVWRNQRVAERYLRRESPETLTGYILYSERVLYRLWGRLEDAIREGSNRWTQEFGGRDDIFEHFFSTDEDKETFLRGMNGLGLLSSPAAVAAFDLGRFERMVDLGGGTAHLAIAACRRYPRLRATVFDLPAVRPLAERYVAEAGLADRVDVVAGDFFRDALPAADLFAMGRILHDWSDDKVRLLLRKIHERLPPGGALLICEKILDERKDGPATGLLQSLNMLVCTEGRERSASEYAALTEEAGFAEFRAVKTGGPVDALLAVKGERDG